MSTTDFDAAVERAARAMLELAGFGNIDFWNELAGAALQAIGGGRRVDALARVRQRTGRVHVGFSLRFGPRLGRAVHPGGEMSTEMELSCDKHHKKAFDAALAAVIAYYNSEVEFQKRIIAGRDALVAKLHSEKDVLHGRVNHLAGELAKVRSTPNRGG